MKTFVIASATILITVGGALRLTHLYETHLSHGYAPILRATLQSSHLEERAQYIHEARVAVRTDKDQETEAKLEKLQDAPGRGRPKASK
jgi:hypothetical protein